MGGIGRLIQKLVAMLFSRKKGDDFDRMFSVKIIASLLSLQCFRISHASYCLSIELQFRSFCHFKKNR